MKASFILEPFRGRLPWKNNTFWGNKFEGPTPLTEGVEQSIFEANAIPGPPRVQTVILSRDLRAGGATNADIRARITYGIGAAQNSFDVDWGRGLQLPIVANWIRVNWVTWRPNTTAAYNAANGQLRLTAGIAEGALTPSAPPTFTQPRVQLANTAGHLDIVPEFAKAFCLHLDILNPLPTPSLFTATPRAGVAAEFGDYDWQQIIGRFVPLPGGADRMQISNNSGGAQNFTLQYALGL